jgi:uncharacterized lipoprotein
MKKLVLFFAIATVVALSACSSKTQEAPAVDEPVQTEEPAPAPAQEEAPAEVPAETPAETPAE